MMRLFRRTPKVTSTPASDKNGQESSEKTEAKEEKEKEEPQVEAKEAEEESKTNGVTADLSNMSEERTGSLENSRASSSNLSQISETQTFLSVESNDFEDQLNHSEGEFENTNELKITENRNEEEKESEELEVKEKEEPQLEVKEEGEGSKRKEEAQETLNRQEDRKGNYVKYKNERNKYMQQKKRQQRPGYISPSYYYGPNYNYANYANYNNQGYGNMMEYNFKESGYSTPIQQQLEHNYYKDEYYHSPANRTNKVQMEGYGNYQDYESPSTQNYQNHYGNYQAMEFTESPEYAFSPKRNYDYKSNLNADKGYGPMYKPQTVKTQIKPRQKAALQILNPETGEVVNSIKEKEDKKGESSSSSSSNNNKEEEKKEVKTPTNMVKYTQVIQPPQPPQPPQPLQPPQPQLHPPRMLSQMIGTPTKVTKTRIKIKNQPINPSEVIFTLLELHPHKESMMPKEHSKSQQRKIINIPLKLVKERDEVGSVVNGSSKLMVKKDGEGDDEVDDEYNELEGNRKTQKVVVGQVEKVLEKVKEAVNDSYEILNQIEEESKMYTKKYVIIEKNENKEYQIGQLLYLALNMKVRRNESIGQFKLVPLNYTINTKKKQKKDNKWRSEISIEKEEITTFNLRKTTLTKQDQYKRSIRTLLNKLTVENFLVVSEKIANLYKEAVEKEQVETIVDLLQEKATLELNYSDMYADLAFLLRYSFNDQLDVGSKTTCFHKTLLNKCQDSFEEISTNPSLNKDYILGNIRFMGELFLRKILSITILKRISFTLLTAKHTKEELEVNNNNNSNNDNNNNNSNNNKDNNNNDSNNKDKGDQFDRNGVVRENDDTSNKDGSKLEEEVLKGTKEEDDKGSDGKLEEKQEHEPDKDQKQDKHQDEQEHEKRSSKDKGDKDKSKDKEESSQEKEIEMMFQPPENLIECFSELLTTIGYTVDQIPGGSEMLDEYVGILITLKNSNIYPTRINFKIQDLIDLRKRNWKMKLFKEKATSVSQIHKQVEQEQTRGTTSQEGKYVTAGLQTNRHYTQYLLNKRQQALESMVNGVYAKSSQSQSDTSSAAFMSTSKDGDFSHEILKLFLTCPDQDTLQKEWVKYKPTDEDVEQTFTQLLKSTLTNKTLELCLILSELISFILTKLVDSQILRAKLLNNLCDSYVVRLHDELLDNPWAMIIVSKIMTLLFCNFTGEAKNLLEKISIPKDFSTSKKLASNIIQGTKDQGGDLGFTRRVIRRHLYSTFPQQNLLFLDEI